MERKKTCVRVCGLLLVFFLWMEAKAQVATQSPFEKLQQAALDSSSQGDLFTGLSYPASLAATHFAWQVSMGKLLLVPGWNQMVLVLQGGNRNNALSAAVLHEQVTKMAQTQLLLRLAKPLGHGIAAGVLLGFLKSSVTGYQVQYNPVARLGLQTVIAPTVLSSFALTVQGKVYGPTQTTGPRAIAIQVCTQLQLNKSVIAMIQCQKRLFTTLEWMGLLRYQPDKKIQLLIGCQPVPLWWVLKTRFLVQHFPVTVSVALHPSLGAVSFFTLQNPRIY
jgi:hypothetical protein